MDKIAAENVSLLIKVANLPDNELEKLAAELGMTKEAIGRLLGRGLMQGLRSLSGRGRLVGMAPSAPGGALSRAFTTLTRGPTPRLGPPSIPRGGGGVTPLSMRDITFLGGPTRGALSPELARRLGAVPGSLRAVAPASQVGPHGIRSRLPQLLETQTRWRGRMIPRPGTVPAGVRATGGGRGAIPVPSPRGAAPPAGAPWTFGRKLKWGLGLGGAGLAGYGLLGGEPEQAAAQQYYSSPYMGQQMSYGTMGY